MKTIIFFICTLFCAISLYAQNYYYSTTKTFNESGYTYQCDVRGSKMATIYNSSNKWIYTYPVYKNTGEDFVQTDEGIDLLENDNWTNAKCESIVNDALSASEKQRVKGDMLTIIMYINSSTGKVDEVSFEFHSRDPFATIPISVYRKIENEIKKNIWFTLTAEGKSLNYIFFWRTFEPK